MFISLLTVVGILKCINDKSRHVNAMRTLYGCSAALCIFSALCKLAFSQII